MLAVLRKTVLGALILLLSLHQGVLHAASDRGIIIQPPRHPMVNAEQRVALIIGNGAYENAPLKNPVNDARAIAGALSGMGFEVVKRENLDQKEMKREIQAFGQRLLRGGVGLFYYAGHGMQVNGRNYLIPIGAHIEHEKQVEYEAVDAGAVLSEMDHARNRLNIVILDACRDNPFARSFRSTAQGLASMNAPSGTLIAYATAPGSVAGDGEGAHGIYTGELVKTMQIPNLKIEDVFKIVRTNVREITQGNQIPWESSSLEGDFFFKLSPDNGAHAQVAEPVTSAPALQVAQLPRSEGPVQTISQRTWKEPVSGIEFVWVPGGCFFMGTPQDEEGRDNDETPVHEVCVGDFWMSKTEVTNGQFKKFQPEHSSREYQGLSLKGDEQPVVYVSWRDAVDFAQWLTNKNGGQYKFRLPTEAEWEYACRGGTETARYWGEDPEGACVHENVADLTAGRQLGLTDIHHCEDGYAATAPVASFQPNPFGLYDMLGNVWEWCLDQYDAAGYFRHERDNPVIKDSRGNAERVIRGGYWHGGPAGVRCGDRGAGLPGGMNDDLGMRLVREP